MESRSSIQPDEIQVLRHDALAVQDACNIVSNRGAYQRHYLRYIEAHLWRRSD